MCALDYTWSFLSKKTYLDGQYSSLYNLKSSVCETRYRLILSANRTNLISYCTLLTSFVSRIVSQLTITNTIAFRMVCHLNSLTSKTENLDQNIYFKLNWKKFFCRYLHWPLMFFLKDRIASVTSNKRRLWPVYTQCFNGFDNFKVGNWFFWSRLTR